MRALFWTLWAGLLLLKLVLAARVPLFVDEGFYWLEGRHLAWAYSDLPGLTAWLVRLGEIVGGTTLPGIRWPFLLLGSLAPWLVVRIAGRLHPELAWPAGLLALLLPLSGTLGLFALPDVPLVLAGLLCVDAVLRLLQRVDAGGALQLAAGLVLGGLAHYRFAGTLGAGLLALLLLPEGRRLLRDARVWGAIAAGALAWLPLLAWNRAHGGAGWRFQLLERHPWEFHADGWLFLLVQPVLVTPLLFVALVAGVLRGAGTGRLTAAAARERGGEGAEAPERMARVRYLAWFGGLTLAGLFVIGFFADAQRISFHWPLTAELALLPLAAEALRRWPAWLRGATLALAAMGLAAVLGYCVLLARGAGLAPEPKWYPSGFAGWGELAAQVQEHLSSPADGTQLVAGDFKIAAQLGFALADPAIPVLPHPDNRQHGRDVQLALWRQRADARADLGVRPLLLVVDPASVKPRELAAYAQALCDWAGGLPRATEVRVDGGRRRFLLFALPANGAPGDCTGVGLAEPAPSAAAR